MRTAVLHPDRHVRIETRPFPEIPKGGALIRVTGCGLCGSDVEKRYHRSVNDPLVLGHEVAGVIEALSPEAEDKDRWFSPGQRVALAHHVPCQTCYYCLHDAPSMCRTFKKTNIVPGGFSEYIAVSAEHLAHTVFPLPKAISDAVGSCIEPLSCCLRAVDRIPAQAGQTVLVVGLGFIGLLTAQLLKYYGFQVFGVDLDPERVTLARRHGWIDDGDIRPEMLLKAIRKNTLERGVDTVFLSVVSRSTLDLGLKAVRDGGLLMLFASHGDDTPILDQNALYFRELTVMTSYSPSLNHLQKAHELIINRQIAVEPLLSAHYSLDDLDRAFDDYRSGVIMKAFINL